MIAGQPRTIPRVLTVGGALLALATEAHSQSQWCEQAELVPCQSQSSSGFLGDTGALAVAMDGDVLVQGVQGADSLDPCDSECDAGSALVYRRNAGTWFLEAILVAPDAACGARFGRAVAISGDRILVGAQGGAPGNDLIDEHDTVGSAYVFAFDGAGWTHEQTLVDAEGQVGDHFGDQVALYGDYAVITARGDNPILGGSPDHTGSALVFYRTPPSGPWTFQQRIVAQDAQPYDWFGYSVDMEGDRIAIGAPRKGTSCNTLWPGMAYVFKFDGTVWSQEVSTLFANDCVNGNQYFGSDVSIRGNCLAVGAPLYGLPGAHVGAIYMFARPTNDWVFTTRIDPPTLDTELGAPLVFSGSTLAAGTPRFVSGAGTNEGRVLVYDVADCANWSQPIIILPSDPAVEDGFGSGVDLSGTTLVAASPGDDDGGLNSGSAYLFDLSGIDCQLEVATCLGTPYCFGDGTSGACPCGNQGTPGSGCANSAGGGARLSGSSGSLSVTSDDLVMAAICIPTNKPGIFFRGPNQAVISFGDGLRCVGGSLKRYPPQNSGPLGQLTLGPGIVAGSHGQISAGDTWNFQAWYRDPMGSPCGFFFNLSNGLAVTFEP